MKKLLSAILATALLLTLIACGSDSSEETSGSEKRKKTSAMTELTRPSESTTRPKVTRQTESPEQARLRQTLKTADKNYANRKYLDALESYREALAIDGKSQEAKDGVAKAEQAYRTDLLSQAEKALTKREYDSAKETLNEGLSHMPGDSELLEKRDSIAERKIQDTIDDANKMAEGGDWDGAQKALEDAIAENPKNKTVNEAYNDLLDRMPITLKNITTVSSDHIEVVKDVIKDRYGNIYDGGVRFGDRWHNNPFALYNLSGKYTTFTATAFSTEDAYNGVKTSIAIYLDEELVFFKDEITNETSPIEISINVKDKQTMRIKISGDYDIAIMFANSSFEKVSQESANSPASKQAVNP